MSQWTGGWCRIRNLVELHFRKGGATIDQPDSDTLKFTENKVNIPNELLGARIMIGAGIQENGGFLKVSGGVVFTATKGYCLPRAGSVVGLTYQLTCTTGGLGKSADVEVRINNINVFSSNAEFGSGSAEYKGVSTQSRNLDTFISGDLLSVHITLNGGAVIEKVFTLVELQFDT